jgi:hypothetical protein
MFVERQFEDEKSVEHHLIREISVGNGDYLRRRKARIWENSDGNAGDEDRQTPEVS